MQTHDTYPLAPRRLRVRPVSTGKKVTASERDILWFEAIHRHGPLPSVYLHEFTKHLGINAKASRVRLADLFHESETPHGGPYLSRPAQQFDTMDARYQDLVYDLTPASIAALKERGLWHDKAPSERNPWKHAFMIACITASVELGCARRGLRYIPQAELLDRAGATLRAEVPFEWKRERHTAALIPDALFAIDYGGRYRAFLLEADRSTEGSRVKDPSRKSHLRNVLQYRAFVGGGLYKGHYALKAGVLVLTVTTSETVSRRIQSIVEEVCGSNTFMCFQTAPEFGSYFKPPKVLERLEKPWQRVGHEPIDIFQ